MDRTSNSGCTLAFVLSLKGEENERSQRASARRGRDLAGGHGMDVGNDFRSLGGHFLDAGNDSRDSGSEFVDVGNHSLNVGNDPET